MKRFFYLVVLLAAGLSVSLSQLTVVSTSPANGTTNVPLSTTVSITFSAALDTTALPGFFNGAFWSFQPSSGPAVSVDRKTLSWNVTLSPGIAQYVVIYHAKGADGSTLTTPVVFYFTDLSSFPGASVSGAVSAGTTGANTAGCLVVLSDVPVGDQDPNLIIGGVATTGGAYTIPHVKNGVYWPIAVLDENHDGEIDPDNGDPIAFGDSIIVSGSPLTGIDLTLERFGPKTFSAARDIAQGLESIFLPDDYSLRLVSGYDADTSGVCSDWQFIYYLPGDPKGATLSVRSMRNDVDTLDSWRRSTVPSLRGLDSIDQAVDAAVFLANCNNAGGREYAMMNHGDSLGFHVYVELGDLRQSQWNDMVPDTTKQYWGATYWWGRTTDTVWYIRMQRRFVGDLKTGAILRTTDVETGSPASVPEHIALEQNYPNPFNPSTTITFSLPSSQEVQLLVFNVLGEQVATLANGMHGAGTHAVRFSADGLSSGVYFTVLKAGGRMFTAKMMLLR